jgi:hypothetical protein
MFSGTQPDTSLLLMGSKGLTMSAQTKGNSTVIELSTER